MVKLLTHTLALLRLIRWPNLLMVAFAQVLIRQCLLVPLLKQMDMEPQLSMPMFVMLVLATVFIAAGGYIINDYFDRDLDRINRPQTFIIGRVIWPRQAMAWYLVFTITGLLLGTWVAVRAEELFLGIIFFMASGLLWFYSNTYKHELLLGNILVALMTALVPFLVVLFELPLLLRHYGTVFKPISPYLMIWVLGFSLFAFMLNLVREIIKDVEDFEGDKAYGKNTIPVKWGFGPARWISVIILLLTMLLLAAAWFYYVRDIYTLLYFIVLIIVPLIAAIAMLLKGGNKAKYGRISTLLKIIMITGLGYMIVVNLIINYLP
jgi:4-hydroxybenzoate polyprenyltransferase